MQSHSILKDWENKTEKLLYPLSKRNIKQLYIHSKLLQLLQYDLPIKY